MTPDVAGTSRLPACNSSRLWWTCGLCNCVSVTLYDDLWELRGEVTSVREIQCNLSILHISVACLAGSGWLSAF